MNHLKSLAASLHHTFIDKSMYTATGSVYFFIKELTQFAYKAWHSAETVIILHQLRYYATISSPDDNSLWVYVHVYASGVMDTIW